MKTIDFRILSIIILILTIFFQGCTVINLGIGTALDPPEREKEINEFELREPKPNGYTNTVNTKDGEINTAVLTDFLVKTSSDDLLTIRSEATVITSNYEFTSTLSRVSYSEDNSFFILDNAQKISLDDIQSIAFKTTSFKKDSLLNIEAALTDTLLTGKDIEEIYLGFGTTFDGFQPDFAHVIPLKEVESIHYKEPVMNMGTMYLVSVGLVADVIIGTILLLKAL